MPDCRTANILGALALTLTDAMRDAVDRSAPEAGAAPAAISLVGHEPGMSIDRLRRALGMSHPGAVRLVDRLEADGVIERRPAARDGRAVALFLTEPGLGTRAAIQASRARSLQGALDRLEPGEREQLAALAGKLLAGLVLDEAAAYATCRLCDERACVNCPVERGLAAVP